ncbi:MAG: nucleoside-diphosphate-sugar epimerase, partial [Thermoleophilaceae bacterium]|nr:nucleoside-diphosphate-sugar epimerase [Thermoleophilaceae bacterium]
VATGRRIGVRELAEQLAGALGSGIQPEVTGQFRAGDIRHCFADTTRATELLGFRAERDLSEGLPELAEWVAGQDVAENGDRAAADLRARGLLT